MAKRIICTRQSAPSKAGHGHILDVGIGTRADQYDYREDVSTVRMNILAGQLYYTQGKTSGKQARVERFDCWCGIKTIKSAPDAVADNNLDSLPTCSV